jgi:hypothetical protein
VPTVVDEMEFQMLVVGGFRDKIVEVCKKIGYEFAEKKVFAA